MKPIGEIFLRTKGELRLLENSLLSMDCKDIIHHRVVLSGLLEDLKLSFDVYRHKRPQLEWIDWEKAVPILMKRCYIVIVDASKYLTKEIRGVI